jgi:hypothetical protein
MKVFLRRRRGFRALDSIHREDPLSGVANLFDASIVFAVGLMVALIQAFSLTALLDPAAEFTIMRRDPASGRMEIIDKRAHEITVRRMTPEQRAGEGLRLGVAYRLADGTVVYVPESDGTSR